MVLYLYLRDAEGYCWDHKRIHRTYPDLALNLRIKPRRQLRRGKHDALSLPGGPNQVWPRDFMSDSLVNGRSLRTFNVLDDYNHEGLGSRSNNSDA